MTAPRYDLLRLLGSGGMAQVFEATAVADSGISRRVAIKRILPHLARDQSMRQLFFEEARVASRLQHGSIVQVLDYGDVDGSQFIVMEFVHGLDAMTAVEHGRAAGTPIPEGVALHVTCAVAEALRYVHGLSDDDGVPLGVVHRDVSPHNVLLSWEGDVKLSDFGIALEKDRTMRTTAGIVRGKMAFLSPEQLRGERATSASDVHALGATLHALLTGDAPHESQLDLVRLIDGGPPDIDPTIADDITELLLRCMAFAPAERPSAEEVAAMASRLLVQRGVGDGRGALRAWLAALQPRAAAVGRLDDLMGLVMSPGSEARDYTVTSETPGDERAQERWERLSQPPPPDTTTAAPAAPVAPAASAATRTVPDASVAPAAPAGRAQAVQPASRRGLVLAIALLGGIFIIALTIGAAIFVIDAMQDEPAPLVPSPPTPPRPAPMPAAAGLDEWHQGVLDDTDARLTTDGSLYDVYPFYAAAGSHLVVTMESAAFDTYLALQGPDGNIIARNDDVATGVLDSRIELVAPMTGTYQVIANALRPAGRGPYRLHIVTAPSM